MWYWFVIAISFIVVSVISCIYIEKELKKRYEITDARVILTEITILILVLLWVSFLLGIFIGKNMIE